MPRDVATYASTWREAAALLRRLRRGPQDDLRRLLIGHALGIGDQLELQAPGRQEIEDRLAGGRALIDGDRTLHGLDVLGLKIGGGLLDIVDIEGDMVPAQIAVLR